MNEVINVIWRLAIAAELVLAARLLIQGLAGIYPALLTGSCVFALQGLLLMSSASSDRSTMESAWKVSEPLVWILWAWITFELFSAWTRNYTGIGKFGRYLFVVLMVLAVALSVSISPLEWRTGGFSQIFRIYYILNRVLMAALGLFIVSVWIFFRNYRAPVPSNVYRHTAVTATYLTLNGLTQLTFTLGGSKTFTIVNLALVIFSAGCFCAWVILLTRKGEAKESIPDLEPEEIERIERINRELLVFMKELPDEVGAGKY